MMRFTTPKVYLIQKPQIEWDEIERYLIDVGGEEWLDHVDSCYDGQHLIEFSGRLCYRSWKPGLNPNVRKVRTNNTAYLHHILESKHGSVLEHANYTFVFHNVSRVFTHELVRHRAGTAISQESMRFVRINDVPMWIPEWAQEDEEVLSMVRFNLGIQDHMQRWMAEHFDLDNLSFQKKKELTSFMRRFAPEGISTDIVWTANVRTLRHVIEARTAVGAEEEIRMVFGEVCEIMKYECPALFDDFIKVPINDNTEFMWVPEWSKV